MLRALRALVSKMSLLVGSEIVVGQRGGLLTDWTRCTIRGPGQSVLSPVGLIDRVAKSIHTKGNASRVQWQGGEHGFESIITRTFATRRFRHSFYLSEDIFYVAFYRSDRNKVGHHQLYRGTS